jgi:hypothetical protein
LIFQLSVYRFSFRAVDPVYFPPGKAANVLRGALGIHLVRERLMGGPSGLADPPRPYVFRAAHLDGKRFEPGEVFSLDVHIFDLRAPLRDNLLRAFAEWQRLGLGPGRGRVELIHTDHGPGSEETVALELAGGEARTWCTVAFRTPTELKGIPAGQQMPFEPLFARVRDRISTLRSLYAEGPVEIDFKAMSERAASVKTLKCDLQYQDVMRRSSRTGDVHGIGGFTGTVDYEGELGEFLPWLRAAWWTGVGRHTVWGNGVIEVVS